ncbi:MAG: YihA family ribosome biogenesis GTP-binding protein [Pelagibacteraceae bacterium TMED124]|nr:hypothetical protein [Rickettsiales bacterium]RPG18414.1 MAG: YihA family ribosome biogenesis GTP-binding protein [Pelagibacteraceae bacterium TMED124]
MSEDWKFIKEVHSFKELPSDQIPEFIFWGRSNVGKSSLINSLTKKEIAKTSRTPGRTKSLVFFQYKNILRIVDFPGYGFSKISANQTFKLNLLLEGYFQKRENLKKIFLLIDSRHLLKPIDLSIIKLLEQTCEKEIIFVFTKKDKIKNLELKKKNNESLNLIKKEFNKNIFNTSIKESNGIILLKKFLFRSQSIND